MNSNALVSKYTQGRWMPQELDDISLLRDGI